MSKNRAPLELLKELVAAGSPADFSVADGQIAPVQILQVGDILTTSIFELEDQRTGYRLDVAIINQTSKSICCWDIELYLPWEDPNFEWLPDPKQTLGGEHGDYKFPGKTGLALARDEVLNHLLLCGGVVKPGRLYKGWLLGVGGPMPQHLRRAKGVQGSVAIITENGEEYAGTMQFLVLPLARKPKNLIRTGGLFEEKAGETQLVDAGPLLRLEGEADTIGRSIPETSEHTHRAKREVKQMLAEKAKHR